MIIKSVESNMFENEQEFNQELGKRLTASRQTRKMSQEQLGAYIGVRGQQIHKYETGENRITPQRLNICSKILGVPISYFYGEEEGSGYTKTYDRAVINIAAEISDLPKDIRQGVYVLIRIINKRRKRDLEKVKKAG